MQDCDAYRFLNDLLLDRTAMHGTSRAANWNAVTYICILSNTKGASSMS